jgi:hypothetical protein
MLKEIHTRFCMHNSKNPVFVHKSDFHEPIFSDLSPSYVDNCTEYICIFPRLMNPQREDKYEEEFPHNHCVVP